MMIPTMMTLSIPMTNKCLQAIQMQNHHIINSSFPHILMSVATHPYHIIMSSHYHIATDPKITWRTLSQKYPENVTV